MTKLCVPMMVDSLDQALAAAARAAELGADLVEYRIDQFADDAEQVASLVAQSPLPCIVTCRPAWEGGHYDGDEQQRISMIEHVGMASHAPAYFDVELAAYSSSKNLRQKVNLVVDHEKQVRSVQAGLILSSHDFTQRPADLSKKVRAMAEEAACRVIKVAWRARSLRDNLEAFEIIESRYKPTIALCMGEEGLMSRVLAKKFGAVLTFVALEDGAGTAPGQPTVDEIKKLYRWDSINAATRVYGVIGHPVSHSMSPAIHNAGFDAADFNGVYLPLPIAPSYEAFKATVGSMLEHKSLHFRGASVTIPHKENLLRFVKEMGGTIDPLAETIGAANTLVVDDDGSLAALNTDYDGALDAVCDSLDITREGFKGMQVAVIGAGGAARAIVAGFAHYGANVTIYNRTQSKAKDLADDVANRENMPVSAAPLDDLANADAAVFINCTPIGMHPKVDASPLGDGKLPSSFGPGTVVFDTIYNPIETLLLRQAREAGCLTIAGTAMFTRQGAAQFVRWTGKAAPLDVFERVLLEKLSAKR